MGFHETSIFIIDNHDPITPHSQKYLLENHKHSVVIINNNNRHLIAHIEQDDIVLLDVSLDKPNNFTALNTLLKQSSRPKLLLTAIENQIFNCVDEFYGGLAKILFKPFTPQDLISEINGLSRINHV